MGWGGVGGGVLFVMEFVLAHYFHCFEMNIAPVEGSLPWAFRFDVVLDIFTFIFF